MSIHVCECARDGKHEWHLRYPGMTEAEAQALADKINGGEVGGDATYWRRRARVVEQRLSQLEKEIIRLRGGKPLTAEFIAEHNQALSQEKPAPTGESKS